jgi:type I site-specific restriction endonuclease
MGKKTLSEQDIYTKFITPAITANGWSTNLQMREGDSHLWARRCAWQQDLSRQGAIEKLLTHTAIRKTRLAAAQAKQLHMAEALASEVV